MGMTYTVSSAPGEFVQGASGTERQAENRDMYNYYKSLPGYIVMFANAILVVGIVFLFFSWPISVVLFATAFFLWCLSAVLHDLRSGRPTLYWAMAQKYKNPESIEESKARGLSDEGIKALHGEAVSMAKRAFRLWNAVQLVTIILTIVFLIAALFSSWWYLVPVLPTVGLNMLAYTKKMLSIGRDPSTNDLDEVL